MTPSPDTGHRPAAAPRRESPRVQLARLAAEATAACAGVAGLDRGQHDRYCTHVGTEKLPGVIVVADGDPGTYAVSLYLRAELTDLHALAERVRAAIRTAATDGGLSEHLGEVRVAITDIDDGTTTA